MTCTPPSEPHHRSETWDATATDYEAFAEPFTRQYAQAALDLAGGVRPGERVLDVAAGTGALTLLAARAGARVLATDFSPGMVARLKPGSTPRASRRPAASRASWMGRRSTSLAPRSMPRSRSSA